MKNISIQKPLQRVQKQLAIRIIAGYRTIAYEVAILLARTPPWNLVAEKLHKIYGRIRRTKGEETWSKEMEGEIKEEEETEMQRL